MPRCRPGCAPRRRRAGGPLGRTHCGGASQGVCQGRRRSRAGVPRPHLDRDTPTRREAGSRERIGNGQPYPTGSSRYQPDSAPRTQKVERPSQRTFDLVWQVLGSNQRRRCRQIYRPPRNPALTRPNSTERASQGPHRDRTAVDHRRRSRSSRQPQRDGRDARAPRSYLPSRASDLEPAMARDRLLRPTARAPQSSARRREVRRLTPTAR